ncbi:putative peroxidase, family 2 [Lyophyllum shimeji]|uniref:Peroxidase, family 2 n=1 Tax=Lyophyllum shimeji TaxID=47721 RepID=A0A9P3UJF3_LYOSH|nr:putative peroxidase, family 2 [Lyophyllum shimeji]
MIVSCGLVFLATALPAFGFPHLASRQDTGVVIVAPPRPTNTGILPMPGSANPFVAPGANDLRGPCPGLNTLANHGFLPRNGVASFEDIVNAATHAFNMDYDLASALAAFGMLARGNAFIDKVSIGLPSDLVPPLPGQIDGPLARGLATHGRFEGDVSMTRQDAAIGDNRNFQPALYSQLLDLVSQFGDDSTVTGPRSIVNMKVMQEFKFKRFTDSQAADKQLQYHVGRLLLSYGESAFTLNFFANGTDGTLSVPTMTSFFRDQTFPANWNRRSAPGGLSLIGNDAVNVLAAHPVLPGANNANGVYVTDNTAIDTCALYSNLAGDNLPGVLLNTTGVLKQNVGFLLNTIHNLFSNCTVVVPHGPANV